MDETTDRRLGESLRDYATRLIQENTPTLRDQFAMAALSALVLKEWHEEGRITITDLAVESYRYADAILEARKVQP